MSTNILNNVAFLRTSREFPDEVKELSLQVNKAYIDTANAVNTRVIGLYAVNKSTITGEVYFIEGNIRQQALRQLYAFSATTTISHGIQKVTASQFINCSGRYTDGTNGYGLIWGTSGAIPNQISFYVTDTQIVFVVDGGAPALTSGTITLNWLSNP